MPLIPERFPRTATAYVLATVAIAVLSTPGSALPKVDWKDQDFLSPSLALVLGDGLSVVSWVLASVAMFWLMARAARSLPLRSLTVTSIGLMVGAVWLMAALSSADVVRWLSYTLTGVVFWSFFIGFGGLIHCAYLRRK